MLRSGRSTVILLVNRELSPLYTLVLFFKLTSTHLTLHGILRVMHGIDIFMTMGHKV